MIIPLGTRCTAASVVRYRIGVVQPAFVFDWAQFSVETMVEVLSLGVDQVEPYFESYFGCEFTSEKRHPVRGDWLPHDFVPGVPVKLIREKYVRRTHRFLNALTKTGTKTFLTVGTFRPDEADPSVVRTIWDTLVPRTDGDLLLLAVNCGLGHLEGQSRKHHELECHTWSQFDDGVESWIRSLGVHI